MVKLRRLDKDINGMLQGLNLLVFQREGNGLMVFRQINHIKICNSEKLLAVYFK